jgi:hypothetical protein
MPARDAAWLGVTLFVVACGGATPPAESAEPSAPPPTEEAPSAEPAKAEPSAPSSEADVSAVLQLVVDDLELDKFLHLEKAGRFPLRIAGEKLPSDLKLIKSNEPVKIVQGPKDKTDAVLVIMELSVQGDDASVRYRYDAEGIRGTVTLKRSAHGWELKNSRIVER